MPFFLTFGGMGINLICIGIVMVVAAKQFRFEKKSQSEETVLNLWLSVSLSYKAFVTLDMHFVKLLGRMGAFPASNVS
jgi:hypothetical protein